MTVQQIQALGPALCEYLDEFADCFVSPDTHYHLKEYVKGQLSDLRRKNVQRIARLMDVPPRTLQEFLSLSEWDEDRLRDTVQRLVVRDHVEAQAVGIVDESGHAKKGRKTALVHRDYCGATGKVDNCVMGVHVCYASFDGPFRAMLDSDLYVPKEGWDDPKRRAEAAIPASVVYRGKHVMALEQFARAVENGVGFAWVTADEWYGEKPAFIQGLEEMKLRFVLEIPRNLMGWLYEPKDLDARRGEVQHLVRWSGPMLRQEWVQYYIKDTDKGPLVWEVRASPFWMKREGNVVGPYWLVAARDRLDQDTIKYFLSNASAGVPLEAILHVAFLRWPVERTLEDQKSELGMSNFMVRKYPSVLRHLRITQVSHLFLARQTERLREKKPGGDDLPGAQGGRRAAGCVDAATRGPQAAVAEDRLPYPGRSERQRRGTSIAHQDASESVKGQGDLPRQAPLLRPAAAGVALWD
jgi:SRSO17 transposase